MMERCQKMKQEKQQMMADMKAQDDQLMEQIAKMNRAPHDKKIGLMADVLTHMAEQRIAMDARKAKMDEEMMQHMMQHMQMGKDSMSQCPMMKDMKDMKGMDDKSESAPKEHPEEQKCIAERRRALCPTVTAARWRLLHRTLPPQLTV